MIKRKIMFMVAVLFLAASAGHAQFSLEIDGQTVVPAGQLIDIRYNPDLRAFVVNSVHSDWRCVTDAGTTPAVSPGDFRLVFDSVNPATETGAVYRIAAEADGGAITQDISGGRIVIQTSSDPAEQLICAPFRASFSSSGFENPLTTRSDAPDSPFTAGGILSIPVTVTNNSLSKVLTSVAVDLTWSTDPSGATGVSSPSFSELVTEPVPGTRRWTVDALFPGESRTIDVEYDVGSQTAAGTVIRTESVVAGAMNRIGDAAIEVGNPLTDVSEVTVGIASGDLEAGLETNNPVAGLDNDNVVLTYSISNNSEIPMTSVQSTLASVTLPPDVSTGSVTPSAGTVSGDQWDVPLIEAGQTVTLDQTFTAEAAAVADAQVCGSFTIDAATEQLINTGNDEASSCAVIRREVDLSSLMAVLNPSSGAVEVNAGESFQVRLQINNGGPSNASSVSAGIALTVDPADAGVLIDAGTSSATFGSLSGGGLSIDFDVDGEMEPNNFPPSADIDVDIPETVVDQTTVCLEVTSLSSTEPDTVPGNNLPSQTCITVVNAGP